MCPLNQPTASKREAHYGGDGNEPFLIVFLPDVQIVESGSWNGYLQIRLGLNDQQYERKKKNKKKIFAFYSPRIEMYMITNVG